MFSFFKKDPAPEAPTGAWEKIEVLVRRHLGQADQATIEIVTALAGLLGAAAYADRQITEEEISLIRKELGRIQGMSKDAVESVALAIEQLRVELSSIEIPRATRTLREAADSELRYQVLEVLMRVAAADGTVTQVETNQLRQIAGALGLSQDDYNRIQSAYRDKLGVLG